MAGKKCSIGCTCKKHKFTDERKAKISAAKTGLKFSDEHRKHLSESKRGRRFSEEHRKCLSKLRKGANNGFYGKHHTQETRNRISQTKRINFTEEDLNKMQKGVVRWRKEHPEFADVISRSLLIYCATDEGKRQRSESSKKNWQSPEYASKVLSRREMSLPEMKLQKIIDDNDLPYIFVGNVSSSKKLVIDRKVPDFVHTDNKKLIEVYGDFFHREDNPQDRINFFRERGYACIIFWASEIERHSLDVLGRIMDFTYGG